MNAYSRLVPRLNGKEIEERFAHYLDLVKKGVAGFIIFGGELDTVRTRLRELQSAAPHPLMIASDLEQGLGQQVEGGTLFPPAMAITSALRGVGSEEASSMLQRLYAASADEARYAGINTILAPVLDVNTNPDNPIIATRSFGEDPDTVSFFGCEMIRAFRKRGVLSCGKHFPGHGDTETDSHIRLPVIRKDLPSLEQAELVPFRRAIDEGVDMIMMGHLSVPALDASGRPASLSEKVVAHLKRALGFKGAIITDAMNMGGIGEYPETEASLMALNAGVDLILHPTDPDAVAAYISTCGRQANPFVSHLPEKFTAGKKRGGESADTTPDFSAHKVISDEIARMAVRAEGDPPAKITRPFLLALSDEDRQSRKDKNFAETLKRRRAGLAHLTIFPGDNIPWSAIPTDRDLIVAVFSQVRAWKGQTAGWLRTAVELLDGKAKTFISFGNPYVLSNVRNTPRIYAFWDSVSAQSAVAEKLLN